MSEQTLEELGTELKKLELKEDDVLIVEYDIESVLPKEINDYMKQISKIIDNKIIAYPNDKSLIIYKENKEYLLKFKNKIDERIDKILKGEE